MTIVPPICTGCRRYWRHPNRTKLACDAYPDGIPYEILTSQADHRQPYSGDRGLRFMPIDAEAEAWAEWVFRDGPAAPTSDDVD